MGIFDSRRTSSFDDTVMINLNSLPNDSIYKGRFFIDGNFTVRKIFDEIESDMKTLKSVTISELNMPASPLESIANGVNMNFILIFLIIGFTIPNNIVAFSFWFSARKKTIQAMKLVGFKPQKIVNKLFFELIILWLLGILLSLLIIFLFIYSELIVTSYSNISLIAAIFILFLVSIGLAFLIIYKNINKKSNHRQTRGKL